MELDTVVQAEALEWMSGLPAQCADMILADLPYGTTACLWDTIIPFEPLWTAFKHVVKPRGAIVLTASQPFTSALVMSNPKQFRCEWIWQKDAGTGYLNANRQPMKAHESILVFSEGTHNYYPVFRAGKPYSATRGAVGGFVRDKTVGGYLTVNSGDRYPLSIIRFSSDIGIHPTQKPVALFEYLIRTYTREGETVLDCCVGSGTTAVAARNTGRRWLCCDSGTDERTGRTWADIANERVRNTDPYQDRTMSNGAKQLSMFSGESHQ